MVAGQAIVLGSDDENINRINHMLLSFHGGFAVHLLFVLQVLMVIQYSAFLVI